MNQVLWILLVIVLIGTHGALLGEYNNGLFSPNSKSIIYQYIDPTISTLNFHFNKSTLPYGMPLNWVQVIWNGSITTANTDTYLLSYAVNDIISLYLDDIFIPSSGSSFSISLESNHTYTILLQFSQYYKESFFSIQSSCCTFTSPPLISIFALDPTEETPSFIRNDTILSFWDVSPFNSFLAVKWTGYLLPPVEFSNQWIVLEFVTGGGVALYVDDDLVHDEFWRSGNQNSTKDLFIHPGSILPICIKAWTGLNGYFEFKWGINGTQRSVVPASALFVTPPIAELKGDIVINGSLLSGSIRIGEGSHVIVQGDLYLVDLYTQSNSNLTVDGNLVVSNEIHLEGNLHVEGSLSISNGIISLSNSILTTTGKTTISDSTILFGANSIQIASGLIEITNTALIVSWDMKYPTRELIRFNSSSIDLNTITLQVTSTSLNCFSLHLLPQKLEVVRNCDPQVINISLVAGLVGGIMGIVIIVGVFIFCKDKMRDKEQIDKLTT